MLCALLPALVLLGCRKKSSPEFFKLESEQSILVARDGDDAWLSPQMDAVLSGLQAISDEAIEKPRAQALASKIVAEQARLKAEQARPPPPAPVDPFAGRLPSAPPPPENPETAELIDAGELSDQPWPGMLEQAFVARFGVCFSPGPKATLPDGQAASAYVLSASPACQKQFGAADARVSYLFTDKGLWGKATETVVIRDAGAMVLPVRPAPPPPPPSSKPPASISIPGAPAPEGYE